MLAVGGCVGFTSLGRCYYARAVVYGYHSCEECLERTHGALRRYLPESVLATAVKNKKSFSRQLAVATDTATQLLITGFIVTTVILQNVRDPQWEGVVDGEVCGLGPIAKSVQTFLHWVAIKLETTDALRLCTSCGDALAREVSRSDVC